jgi:hypothetical protein
VLDSLQKTFAGDSEDSKTPGASDYRQMGSQALGPGDRRPGRDWHRPARLAPFAATKGIGWGLNVGLLKSAKVFRNPADLEFEGLWVSRPAHPH